MSIDLTTETYQAKEVYTNSSNNEIKRLVDLINRMIEKYNLSITAIDGQLDDNETTVTNLLTIQNEVRAQVNSEYVELAASDGEFIYIRPRA